jgi:signal transduction histidine kinase
MSLRIKILILIAGSVLVPIAVFLISFELDTDVRSLRSYGDLIARYKAFREEVGEHSVDLSGIHMLIEDLPVAAEIRVFDEKGSVLFNSGVEALFDEENRFLISEIIPVRFASGGAGSMMITRDAGPLFHNQERWYVPLTGLVFVAVMAILIAQSMNRSIGNLEKATRRIAEGDLDFKLPIKGNDKLASLTRSFDSMRAHLKEEYARRARFIMGISHDLKTPLSSIRGYAAAIGEGYADSQEKLDKYVGIIEDKTKLLESRISMLIDYVKRDTAEWKLNLQQVELGSFFSELAKVFESEAVLNNRKFISEIDIPDGTKVPLDEDMFVRAMENLMHNALTYSPEGSEIRFRCFRDGNSMHVALSNTGPGIRPEDLPHIFDPLFRGTGDRKGPGLGLGLSTAESVISSHGFAISATSEADSETVFSVTMPLKD